MENHGGDDECLAGRKPGNDEAFGRITEDGVDQSIILPIISWTLMPNDCDFVVRSVSDLQLSDFFRWLTQTHTMRWYVHYRAEAR